MVHLMGCLTKNSYPIYDVVSLLDFFLRLANEFRIMVALFMNFCKPILSKEISIY
jgi:hypothetical protein